MELRLPLNFYLKLKIDFYFLICMYVSVSVYGYTQVSADAHGVQMHLIPWAWSYRRL